MNSGRLGRGVLVGLSLLLLVGSNAAFADSPKQLNLSTGGALGGGVTNLGDQFYTVAGGSLVAAMVNGMPLDSGASLRYFFVAEQHGSSTSGWGFMRLTGTIAGVGNVMVSGAFGIDSSVALTIPTQLDGVTPIAGELPGFFISSSPDVEVTVAGTQMVLSQPFMIENPYLNPFGGPIVMTSFDCTSPTPASCTIAIEATYTTGNIVWSGAQSMAMLTGTYGSTSEAGTITLNSNEFEDLVAGTATDSGTVTFSGLTPSSLDVTANYRGTDTIPLTPNVPGSSNDCSAYTGMPGTCTMTGFISSGKFSGGISGTYSTVWSNPAIYFATTVQATVHNGNGGGHGHHGGSAWGGLFGLFGFLQFL